MNFEPLAELDVSILSSCVFPAEWHDTDGTLHKPLRVLMASRKDSTFSGGVRGTIEVRNANTAEFLFDYTQMPSATIVDLAVKNSFTIGNYIFSPHYIQDGVTPAGYQNALAIEYIPPRSDE